MALRAAAGLIILILVGAPVGAEGQYDLTLAAHGVPAEVVAGVRRSVLLELRNDGTEPWDPMTGYAVAYHWLSADGEVVVWDGARSRLPAAVLPGETAAVEAVIEVPPRPGSYRLAWDVVQEGVRWLAEVDPSPPPPIAVEVRTGHAFSVLGGVRIGWVAPGRELTRRIAIRNDGSVTWRTGGEFAASYHWYRRDGSVLVWDGLRTPLPRAVAPGEQIELELRLRTPDTSGRYRFVVDLVHEGVTWFSRQDPTPQPPVTVLVVAAVAVRPPAWAMTTVVGALLAFAVVRRGRPGWALAVVATLDLVWCAGSLLVKQGVVLAAARQPATAGGWLLMLGGAAALLLPLAAVPRRLRPWLVWTVAAAATTLLVGDLVYERFFGDLLSTSLLGAAPQVGRVRASVLSLLERGDHWMWLDLAAAVVLVRAVGRVPRSAGRRSERALAIVLAALVVVGGVTAARLALSSSGVVQQVFRNVYLARELGVVNFHVYDVARFLIRRASTAELTAAEFDDVVRWFADRAARRAGTGPWFGAAAGANLLMVQAESLQGFVLGLEVNGQPVTPFLNRWANQAMVFDAVTDQTAQGRSSDAELLTQVSLLPPVRGSSAFAYPNNHFVGIAGVLAERGYDTLSAVPFDRAFWNRQLTHRAFGYQRSLFTDDFQPAETIGWGLNDRDFFAQMVGRLRSLEPPFCAWLLNLSLHHPFDGFPAHRKVLDLGGWNDTPFGNFIHTMHFFDRAFEGLITGLDRAGLGDSTVVVVWGDHDAGLRWEPELAHMAGQPYDDAGWYLSQQVPLLIAVPGSMGPRGRSAVPAGHQDVAPTVLAVLGVDPAVLPFVGRNLLGEPGGAPVVGEYRCWRDARHLYLAGGPAVDDGTCFALPSLERVDVEACATGFGEAASQQEMSRTVLEHDLQLRLERALAEGLGESR